MLRLAEQAADERLSRCASEPEGRWHKLAILEVLCAIPPEEEFRWPKFRNDRTMVLLHRL
jgi:hypothetical protein